MIRQFLSLLLIPVMLANQGLCFAHGHRGNGLAEPEDHASRPHVHLDGHSSHEHGHSGRSDDVSRAGSDEHVDPQHSAIHPVGEHDKDAIYCSEASNGIREANAAGVGVEKVAAVTAIDRQSDHGNRLLRWKPEDVQLASASAAACPIYLRTRSLRI